MDVFCFKCKKGFSRQSNYTRHCRKIHGLNDKAIVEYAYEATMFKCEECQLSFKRNDHLRHHLSEEHNLDCHIYDQLSFNSYQEFKNWLSCEEKANNVEFEKLTGTKRTCNGKINKIYLNCVRSGKSISPSYPRKRAPKIQGSKKLNRYCTSQIIVDEYEGGKCEVKYFKTHYGHETEIEHLRISKCEKDNIASKLSLGLSTEEILDTFRDNIKTDELHRVDIITRKDINNIKRSYNIDFNIKNICKANNKIEVEVEDELNCTKGLPSKDEIINEIESNLLEIISNVKFGNHSEEQLRFVLEESKNLKSMSIEDHNSFGCNDLNIENVPLKKNIPNHSPKKLKYKSNDNKPNEEEIIIEVMGTGMISDSSSNDSFDM